MEKQHQLVRSCLACGLEKPLAAFLQLTGTQGTVYGNICSACRSASAKGSPVVPKKETDDGDESDGGSGLNMGYKARRAHELIAHEFLEQRDEDKKESRELKDKIASDKTEKKERKEKSEKDHREQYIEVKKRESLFDNKLSPQEKNLLTIRQQNTDVQNRKTTQERTHQDFKDKELLKKRNDFKTDEHKRQNKTVFEDKTRKEQKVRLDKNFLDKQIEIKKKQTFLNQKQATEIQQKKFLTNNQEIKKRQDFKNFQDKSVILDKSFKQTVVKEEKLKRFKAWLEKTNNFEALRRLNTNNNQTNKSVTKESAADSAEKNWKPGSGKRR